MEHQRPNLELNPDKPRVWNNKGSALANLGRFEEALICFDRAIAIYGEYAEAWNNKGEALRRQDKYALAIEYLDKGIEIHPQYPKALNSKGLALIALGRGEDADAAFAKAGMLEKWYNERGAQWSQ